MDFLDSNISSSIETATNGAIGKEWRNDLPEAAYNRIYLPQAGEASFTINKQEYIMRPGQIYLIPAGTGMVTYCREYCRLYWIHYTIKFGLTDNFFAVFPHEMERQANENDHTDMNSLVELYDSHSMRDILIRNAVLQRLTASFLKPGKPNTDISRFTPALQEIELNKTSTNVAILARKCAMSPPYFSSQFKNTFGVPPQKYIIRTRINAAIPRLMNGCTLDEIADELGFHDAFHLSKTFKRIIGCSPRQYRNQMFKSREMP